MGLELLRVNQYPAVSTAGWKTLTSAKTKTAKTFLCLTRSFPAADAGHDRQESSAHGRPAGRAGVASTRPSSGQLCRVSGGQL